MIVFKKRMKWIIAFSFSCIFLLSSFFVHPLFKNPSQTSLTKWLVKLKTLMYQGLLNVL